MVRLEHDSLANLRFSDVGQQGSQSLISRVERFKHVENATRCAKREHASVRRDGQFTYIGFIYHAWGGPNSNLFLCAGDWSRSTAPHRTTRSPALCASSRAASHSSRRIVRPSSAS